MTIGEVAILFGVRVDRAAFAEARSALDSIRRAAVALSAIDFAKNLVESAAKTGTHLMSLAAASGLTVEAVQEWGAVSAKSGASVDQFAVGVGLLESNLRKFANGEGGRQIAGAMRELGITASDAREALASPEGLDRALLQISDRMRALGDTPERAALARQIFGARGARAMLADLANGSEGINKIRENFRALGGELSGEQAANLKRINSAFVDLGASMTGLANRAIATLAPMIVGLLEGLARFAALISNTVVPALQWLTDHWLIVAAGAAGLVGAFVLLQGAAIAAAVDTVLAWLGAALPFVLIAAVIGLLVLAIKDVKNGLDGGRSIILDFGRAFLQWLELAHPQLWAVVMTIGHMGSAIAKAGEWVTELIAKFDNLIDRVSGIKKLAETLRGLTSWNPISAIKTAVTMGDDTDEDIDPDTIKSMPYDKLLDYAYAHPEIRNSVTHKALLQDAQEHPEAFGGQPDSWASAAAPAAVSVVNHFNIPPGMDAKSIASHVAETVGAALRNTGNSLQADLRGGKVRSK